MDRLSDFVNHYTYGRNYYVIFSYMDDDGMHLNSDLMFGSVEEAVAFLYTIMWTYDDDGACFVPPDYSEENDMIAFVILQTGYNSCLVCDVKPEKLQADAYYMMYSWQDDWLARYLEWEEA